MIIGADDQYQIRLFGRTARSGGIDTNLGTLQSEAVNDSLALAAMIAHVIEQGGGGFGTVTGINGGKPLFAQIGGNLAPQTTHGSTIEHL